MEELVAAFRAQREVKRIKDTFAFFKLDESSRVRPELVTYRSEVSSEYLRQVVSKVRKSTKTGLRIGTKFQSHVMKHVQVDQDDTWVSRDDLRELDAACTKFCTQKFLPDASSRVTLVRNVLSVFTQLLALKGGPKGSHVIFKGGVVSRLVLLELVHGLPQACRYHLLKHLSRNKALSVSDMDFEMVEHAAAPEDQNRAILMAFLVLLKFQDEMNREVRERGMGLFKDDYWSPERSEEELRAMLQGTVGGLPAAHPMHGCTIDRVVFFPSEPPADLPHRTRSGAASVKPRENILVFDMPGGKRGVANARDLLRDLGVHVDLLDRVQTTPFYSTLNFYIGEGTAKARDGHLRSLFHLTRIKHTFAIYYTTAAGEKRIDRLAGEMVDMSYGLPGDEARRERARLAPESERYLDYRILGAAGAMRSYSTLGFFVDALYMIHHSEEEPPKVPKLLKRQARYVGFYVGLLMQQLTLEETVRELDTLESKLTGGRGRLRLPVSALVHKYEASVSSQTFRNGFLRHVRAWARALRLAPNVSDAVDDVHLHGMHRFLISLSTT